MGLQAAADIRKIQFAKIDRIDDLAFAKKLGERTKLDGEGHCMLARGALKVLLKARPQITTTGEQQ